MVFSLFKALAHNKNLLRHYATQALNAVSDFGMLVRKNHKRQTVLIAEILTAEV